MKTITNIVVLSVMLALSLPAVSQNTESLYKAKCAACHGTDGAGNTVVGKKFGAKDFNTSELKNETDQGFVDAVKKGRAKMPGFANSLTDEQTKALVKYVRGFQHHDTGAQTQPNTAQTQTNNDGWKAVEDALARKGDLLPGDVIRINMPRTDLHVTLNGTEIKPALALGAWAAFHRIGKEAMIMGDLVLTEDEVAPVMKVLHDGGVEVTALHNHLLGEAPKVMYIHMGGHGDPVKMAETIKAAVALTKTPPPAGAAVKQPEELAFDIPAIEKIIGQTGKVSGGVLHINVPRAETLMQHGFEVPPSMGAGTSINFQPIGNGQAAIAGDLALAGEEVEAAVQALRVNGIETTALHSHMLDVQPTLFYVHFWATDDALKLAKGLRNALDKTNSVKPAMNAKNSQTPQ